MRHWLTSGTVKIERAYEHIGNLEVEISAFRDRRPYRFVRQPDTNDGGTVWLIRESEPIPLRWSGIVADAIHNLHVALDYMWQRAVYGTRHVKRDYFPAFPDPECAKARFRGKEKGRCKQAVDILNRADAFQVGNPFWVIRQFDDADKHDTLDLVACSVDFFCLEHPIHGWQILGSPTGEFIGLKDGTEFRASGMWPKVNVDQEIAFDIAFGEREILKREPVLPSLKNLATTVDSLAAAFEGSGLLR